MKKHLFLYGLLLVMAGSYSCKGKNQNTTTETTPTETTTTTAPVVVNEDEQIRRGLTDATKDFPGVTATVENGVITLTGSIERSRFQTLKTSLDALRPKQIVNNLNYR